jgi:predicted RNase H-related nuclease YkuK (DUF458 family)
MVVHLFCNQVTRVRFLHGAPFYEYNMQRKKFDLEEVKQFIRESSLQSKIYIGCDSTRYKRRGEWFADYALVIVVHKDGKHGCKIFGEVTTQKDFAVMRGKKPRPAFRLMNECYKVSETYIALYDVLYDKEVELHLDINPNPKYASNEVVQQAVGYIRGTCDIDPKVKPEAFAASYAADRVANQLTL